MGGPSSRIALDGAPWVHPNYSATPNRGSEFQACVGHLQYLPTIMALHQHEEGAGCFFPPARHGELGGRSNPPRPGPPTVRPPPTLSRHTGVAESSSRRTPWNSLGCCYSSSRRVVASDPASLHQCSHLIIMGVSLDANISQARWQQLKNMSVDALMLLNVSFPKVWIATSSMPTKTS